MHQPNHNDEDFFDLLDRPEGVVPKNFEASPPDNTRTNISYTPPKPTLNLGNPIGSSLIEGAQEGMQERLPAEISNAPMSQKEMADIAMAMITPFGGTVRAVNAGVRAGAKLLPKVQRGDFEVYKGTRLLKDINQMPSVTNQGGIRRVIEGKTNKIVESVTPKGVNTTGGNKAQHTYRLRPLDDFGKEMSDGSKVFTELAEVKFNMSDKVTLSGTPYQLITDIATFTPKGTNRDYGKLMSVLMKRMDTNWAVKEDDASLDALYGMTKTWLKKAADVEFFDDKLSKQKFFTPKDRFHQSTWIKNNSPFSKAIEKAQREMQLGYESQGIDSPILRDAIDDLARKVTTEWLQSGKVSGQSSNLFEGKVLRNQIGEEIAALESNAFYIKSFKERLAALVGMNETEFDKYLDKDINEK